MVRASLVPLFAVCYSLVAQTPAPEGKHLSLQDAIQTSLQNNLAVDIAKQKREVEYSGITTALGTFDWNLEANASTSHNDFSQNIAASSTVTPIPAKGVANQRSLTADLSKAFTWGGSVDIKYAPSYSASRMVNPAATAWNVAPYSGSLSATYNQNLLQGFGRTISTAPLVIARKNAQSSDYDFQQSIIKLVADTETQYWNLVYAQRFLGSKKIGLELAQKQLKENTIRMQVGTMAPIDVTSAEAQVAQAEQDIISAEADLANAKDSLIRALYPNAERPTSLEATDSPTIAHIQLDEPTAVKMALERRVELKSSKIAREVAQLQVQVNENKTLPSLSAYATYAGGTETYGSLGSVNSDLTGIKYPGYTIGLKFAMPIQNRAAKGNLSAARAGLRSTELNFRDAELNVTLEVRKAVRNVEATEKAVKAAEKTRYYQEKNLEAERKKFENGMSTNFVVLQVMTNLDNARSAELNGQIAYAKAVTELERAVGNLMEARNLKIQ